MESIGNIATESLKSILTDIFSVLPGIIGAIIVILVGWLVIKIISFVLKKIFRLAKMDKISERVNKAQLFGEESNIKIDIAKILLAFVKWVLWLTFIIVAADVLGLSVISTEISNLLHYLPVLLSAMVILMIGMFAAKLLKKALQSVFESMGVGGAKIISSIAYYILLIFVLITALNQAGINTEIITSNITLVIGAFLLAFALALGLGSREIVADLLSAFYARRTYAVGDKIKTKKIEGTIEAIDGISVTVKTKEAKVVVPIKEIVQDKVEIQ